ncbi:taste receptor type 1 member 1 [Elgaria multicarinata webbii]|uniref:taste receptor type 1 member 1 n=1 Tax=Elgaria multicarinata webbii TaxID=159646 RepID=UPI002FCCE560
MGLSLPSCIYLPLLGLCCCTFQGLTSPLRLDGDYTLAGLFPIHRSTISIRQKTTPEVDICESLPYQRLHSYHLIQAMRFAVEEINNSSRLLPNITLGYEIYDTCLPSATMYATLSVLSQAGDGCRGPRHVAVATNYTRYQPKAVAAIGPDNSQNALLTASLLGIIQMPEVSYEASSPTLSLKRIYPSFLRTIPSDRLQVHALVRLLKTFGWIWVAAVASDNNYGQQGLQMLREAVARLGICFAYQGLMPVDQDAGSAQPAQVVQGVVRSKANVAIVFANKRSALAFFQAVVRQNVTGKVWLGTEDWSLATEIWQIPGIRGVGTVMGMSVKQARLPGMEAFRGSEKATPCPDHGQAGACQHCRGRCSQPCSRFCRPESPEGSLDPSPYDMQGASNVYCAVFAVAHGLHHLLGCQMGVCRKGPVYPRQLLTEVKRVNFSIYDRQIYFDSHGDALADYDVVLWTWTELAWGYRVVGSFGANPAHLSIKEDELLWHTEANQIPVSVCSKECDAGEQKVPQGIYRCCFHCVGCSPGTFLNSSDPYTCQKCREDQWSPAGSQTCFERAVVFLAWDNHISLALLTATMLLLSLVAGTAAVFVRNLQTPVVKSAGGWLCFVMLGSLASASSSFFCYFGVPGRLACLLRSPLYNVNATVFLACMMARLFQIVIIFKMAARAPGLYAAWRRYHGPGVLIGTLTSLQGLIELIYLSTSPPVPYKNYDIFHDGVVLECSEGHRVLSYCGMIYNSLLGSVCFVVSYLGKDLPNSYSEAKCITFSLLIYFTSFISFSTAQAVYRGKFLGAICVAFQFSTLSGIFGSYFAPKVYVILFRPERNTNEQFQMSIQTYTKRIH